MHGHMNVKFLQEGTNLNSLCIIYMCVLFKNVSSLEQSGGTDVITYRTGKQSV
jgi:hypothetical protein